MKAKKYNKKKRADEESTGELRNNSENDCKNVPEQKTMTVYTEGYEEAFEDIEDRPNVEPAFVVKNLLEADGCNTRKGQLKQSGSSSKGKDTTRAPLPSYK